MAKAVVSRHWYHSKALWFNIAVAVVGLAGGLAGTGLIPDKYLLLLSVVGNTVLRLLTAQPIAGTPAAIQLQALPPAPVPPPG